MAKIDYVATAQALVDYASQKESEAKALRNTREKLTRAIETGDSGLGGLRLTAGQVSDLTAHRDALDEELLTRCSSNDIKAVAIEEPVEEEEPEPDSD